jgi:hypothetical protein
MREYLLMLTMVVAPIATATTEVIEAGNSSLPGWTGIWCWCSSRRSLSLPPQPHLKPRL